MNYSLDVELQKERSDRMKLEVKVMSPRSAQASMMLPETAREERYYKSNYIIMPLLLSIIIKNGFIIAKFKNHL